MSIQPLTSVSSRIGSYDSSQDSGPSFVNFCNQYNAAVVMLHKFLDLNSRQLTLLTGTSGRCHLGPLPSAPHISVVLSSHQVPFPFNLYNFRWQHKLHTVHFVVSGLFIWTCLNSLSGWKEFMQFCWKLHSPPHTTPESERFSFIISDSLWILLRRQPSFKSMFLFRSLIFTYQKF